MKRASSKLTFLYAPIVGDRMKIIAFVTEPESIRRYLKGVGLPTEPPTIAAARPPPQAEFDF